MDERVDTYIAKHNDFTEILIKIRDVLNSCDLVETVKWGIPTYTVNGKNIIGIGAFKSHCAIWFFQGGLLKDSQNVLINAQEGKTQAMRQWRFNKDSKINTKLLRIYIQDAIDNEKKGLRIIPTKKPLIIPPELSTILKKNKRLANSFEKLTLSKKREFTAYISEAKKESTKNNRLEKVMPLILNNIGLHDKYKKC